MEFSFFKELIVFNQRFISVKRPVNIATFSLFCKMTEFTSPWSNFKKTGQMGQIDGLDDTNCTIASKFLKKSKKFMIPPFDILGF